VVETVLPVAGVDSLTTNDSRPQLTGTVDDAAAVVTVTVNGIAYTATNNGDGTWTLADDTILAINALADGTYDVAVSALDIYGNVGVDATVNELVVDTNIAPVAADDAYNVIVDVPLTTVLGVNDLLLNDIDPDGDPLVVDVVPVSGPSNGVVVLNADGTFTYTPNLGYIGPDSFVYRITDGRGGQSQATVNITVDPVQIAPIAVDDAFIMLEDGSMVIDALSGMLANDSDPNTDPIIVNTTPVTGPANGTLTMAADGSFTYTPNANFNGSDSFTYELQDDRGGTDQATVDITITPVNDAPTGVADNFNVGNAGGLAFTDNALLANDYDVEGDPLTIVAHTNPSSGFLTDDGSGNYFYTPATDFVGNDTFSYTVEDSNGAQSTVFIVINVIDDGVATPPLPEIPDPEPITDPEPLTDEDPDDIPGEEDPVVLPPSGGSSGVQTGTATAVTEWTDSEPAPKAEIETPEKTEIVVEEKIIEPVAMQLASINKLSGFELQGYGMDKVNDEALILALDQMGEDMGATGANNGVLIGTITTGSGFMLTAGIVSWVLRGGALASAMVASMPMLKMMDPLPFVAARRRKKEKEKEEEEERALTDTQRIEKVKKDQWAQDIGAEKLFNGDMKPQGQ
jgi:hypothetical protein